jgi:GNAT superfamily N-acetyltransferase
MLERPLREQRPMPDENVEVRHIESPEVDLYRTLYNGVGGSYLWWERRLIDDATLGRLINRKSIEIHVLYVDEKPAGYVELDLGRANQAQLVYFGLMPGFLGRGLGSFFLDWTVFYAWTKPVARVWVHTCSLDHDNALRTYCRVGFVEYWRQTTTIRDPRRAMRGGG